MATRRVLKCTICVLSFPHMFVSRLMEMLEIESFKVDLLRCLEVIETKGGIVPPVFVQALILAEDHRNELHRGIDPIGIVRALFARLTQREVQGASTIEQQFVRTVTRRYERTIVRKLREQLLALSIGRRMAKSEISSAYLRIAFFGSSCVGINGLKQHFGKDLSKFNSEQALRIVCQLKYPKPQIPSAEWQAKVIRRANYLAARHELAASIASSFETECNQLGSRMGTRMQIAVPCSQEG
jgi:monofunctional glycosyltransferase